jgi:hypothetical protein
LEAGCGRFRFFSPASPLLVVAVFSELVCGVLRDDTPTVFRAVSDLLNQLLPLGKKPRTFVESFLGALDSRRLDTC